MNKFLKNTGNRIMLFIITLVIGICFISSYLSYYKTKDNILSTAYETLTARTNDSSSSIEREFYYRNEQLNNLASLPEIKSMDWNVQQPVLLQEAEKWKFDNIFVMDASGYGYYPDTSEIKDQSNEDFFLKMKKEGSFITEPFIKEDEKKSITTMVTPIKNDSGEIVGYLCGTIDLTDINNIVQSIKFGHDGYAFLLNENGNFIAHNDMNLVFEKINFKQNFNSSNDEKSDQILENVDKADIVITHGGPSSFIMPLQIGKIPIVVPRQKKYDEHVNNHQVEFSTAVKQRYGNIIVVKNIKNLEKAILRYDKIVRTMTTEIDNNNAKFNEKLETIVEDMFQ